MIESKVIEHLLTSNQLQVEIVQFGNGDIPLIAFHGYSRTALDFQYFEEAWQNRYTVYSINLFYHEKSFPLDDSLTGFTLSEDTFVSILNQIFSEFNIQDFALAGYSIGGRIALKTLELFPGRINELWLFAPDGIKKSFWYSLATGTSLGRNLFSGVMKKPQLLKKGIDQAYNWKIIGSKLRQFAWSNIDTSEKRAQLVHVWICYRKLIPNKTNLISLIQSRRIPVYQFYGKHDKVIKPEFGISFAEAINQANNLYIGKCGHWTFTEEIFDKVSQISATQKGR